jgi:hypothetical protein
MCMFCRSLFVHLYFFLLAFVLSVLRFTDSDYPFGIFKLFFENTDAIWNSQSLVCLFDGVNATFNNISVISWRTVLFVEEIGGPGENYRPIASH